MGVTVKIVDDPTIRADTIIANGNGLQIVVNDIPDDKETITKLKKMIFTETTEDLTSRPTCACGDKTQHSILEYTDQDSVCGICGTAVQPQQNHPMVPYVFIKSPNGVAPFIYPVFFYQLLQAFNVKDRTKDRKKIEFNPILFLTDTGYKNSKHPIALGLLENGFERGYNNFVARLPDVISYLSALPQYKNTLSNSNDYLLKSYMRDKDKILTEHLYMINKSLFVIEKTAVKDYMQTGLTDITAIVRMFLGVDVNYEPDEEIKIKENLVAKALKRLSEFYYSYFKEMLSGKGGLVKAHIFSTRSTIGMRVVATSLTRDIAYDEIHLPWGPTVTMLHQYILSKLLKQGYEMESCLRYINKHTKIYSEVIDKIFDEIIAEHPDKCVPLIMQRFPTLAKSNFAATRGTYMKKDPSDLTASIPINSVASQNGDFDGDALHISLIPSIDLWEEIKKLSKHYSYYDLVGNRGINEFLTLSSCIVANAGEYATHNIKTDKKIEAEMYANFS